MTPLTLKILAALAQMHGPDATIASDNQGVDFLLASIQRELHDQAVPRGDSGEKLAFDPRGYAKSYLRTYVRDYSRAYVRTYSRTIR